MSSTYIYYGASTSAVPTWLNFDASLTVRVQNLPVVGRRLARLAANDFEFPLFLKYGDIVKGLPVADASADGVYASHVLEHLSLADMRTALRNTWRILKPGGVFRLIVPDLRERAKRYIAQVEADPQDADAAPNFIREIELGESGSLSGSVHRFRKALALGRHQWMWDYPSMARELEAAGFVGIRPSQFGDADDPRFAEVEQRNRYYTGDIQELSIEARRPA